jgi:hypothetical protein
MNAPASGWHRDPTARHEYRYWDGARWTDDVSDRGVTTTDPMPAGGPGGPGSDPTEVIDVTQAYQTAPGSNPTQAYPTGPGGPPTAQQPGGFGPYGTLPQSGGYGSYGNGGMPPPGPEKKGPNTPLLVGLGLLALVAVVVAVVLFTGGDDDGSETADDPLSDVEVPDAGSGDEPTDSGDTGDQGGSDDTSDVPDDLGDLSELDPSEVDTDVLVDLMADQLVASGGFTEDQANCIAEKMFEELDVNDLEQIGESGDISPEQLNGMTDAMTECMG